MRTSQASDFINTVVPPANRSADYTVEVEFALLSACLREPSIIDSVAALLGSEHFMEQACATVWMVMVNARIECRIVDDDCLRSSLRDLDEGDAENIIARLRNPLIEPNQPLRFAFEIARLARERHPALDVNGISHKN